MSVTRSHPNQNHFGSIKVRNDNKWRCHCGLPMTARNDIFLDPIYNLD